MAPQTYGPAFRPAATTSVYDIERPQGAAQFLSKVSLLAVPS